jgi:hypothetical protein
MSSGSDRVLIAVAAVLYIVSFFLPTAAPFNPEFSDKLLTGWDAFQAGWRAVQSFELREPDAWIFGAAWLANPLCWIAGMATLYERRRVAGVTA